MSAEDDMRDSMLRPGEKSISIDEFNKRLADATRKLLDLHNPENMAARAEHLRKMRLLGLIPPEDKSCPF